jgi:hypothetical protein
MNSFKDSDIFLFKDGMAIYNKKGDSFLDKARNGLSIEQCYNEEDSEAKEIKFVNKIISEKETNRVSLERSCCVRNNEKKYTKKYNEKKICNKKKRGYRVYKNLDVDNTCEHTGLIGCMECDEHYIYEYKEYYEYGGWDSWDIIRMRRNLNPYNDDDWSEYSDYDYYEDVRSYYEEYPFYGSDTDVFDISADGYNDF